MKCILQGQLQTATQTGTYTKEEINTNLENKANIDFSNVTKNDNTLNNINAANRQLSNLDTPQAALAALGAGVRPNLLDNAYFVGGGTGWGIFPINQQNQTTYNAIGAMFDRWKAIYGAEWSAQLLETGLQLTGGTPYADWIQVLRASLAEGDIYTLTALFSNGTLATGQVTAPASNTFSSSVYLTSESYMRLNRVTDDYVFEIVGAPNDTIPTIEFLKLEHGAGQTAAYQKSDGTWAMLPQPEDGDYAGQLAKCQRYFWKSLSPNGYSILGYALATNQAMAYLLIALPVSLRDGITPSLSTINFSNLIFIGTNGMETLAHSWMIDDASAGDKVLIQCRGTFINGQTYLVLLTNSDTLSVSADL